MSDTATAPKKQRLKLTTSTGSFFNYLMSNNSSVPEVGKGATTMSYTDRHVYEVREVSKDGKTVKLEALDAYWDKTKEGGQGHQNWLFKETGRFKTVCWRHNAWRVSCEKVEFIKGVFETKYDALNHKERTAEFNRIGLFREDSNNFNVIEGVTELKVTRHKINILFGAKNYYYDWSF